MKPNFWPGFTWHWPRKLLLCAALGIGAAAVAAEEPAPPLQMHVVNFQSDPAGMNIPAIYRLPVGTGKVPVVVLLHGSGGLDSRGTLHAQDLARMGVATLELDMWGARGVDGGAKTRPARVHDTLPDLFGALAWLKQQPRIDTQRIGVMGFSWGGAMTMLASTEKFGIPADANVPLPVAMVAFYPVCWGYNHVPGYDFKQLRPVHLLVLVGAKDGYDDDPTACTRLVAGLTDAERARTEVHVYPDAEHGFNMLEPAMHYTDPFAHRGKGGDNTSSPNPTAREAARLEVEQFFNKYLSGNAS